MRLEAGIDAGVNRRPPLVEPKARFPAHGVRGDDMRALVSEDARRETTGEQRDPAAMARGSGMRATVYPLLGTARGGNESSDHDRDNEHGSAKIPAPIMAVPIAGIQQSL